jgi:hydroxyethylthiazole kinase-like uncharacterized protein yjeF
MTQPSAREILTPDEMAAVDRMAIAAGPFDGPALMRHAGAAVAAVVLERCPDAARIDVLCGPGNNGGDGYVAAGLLTQAGAAVRLWALAPPRAGSDAAGAAAACPLKPRPLQDFEPDAGAVVIDALFGAGLSKAVEGEAARAIEACNASGVRVVAVDLPSGVPGATGQPLGPAFRADATVTFVRKKPGHWLMPGRALCGDIVVADIGISDTIVAAAGSTCRENGPALWQASWPRLDAGTHKYRRGHVGVFSGPATATGAARLAAMAAARSGAGAVTVLSPAEALAVNGAQLTSIMLRCCEGFDDARAFVAERRADALVVGPGLAAEAATAQLVVDLVGYRPERAPLALVVDASALTALAGDPASFFAAAGSPGGAALVLTPHEGEFARLFPDLSEGSKLERARVAAERSNAVVVLKGFDTVIAAPDGRVAINGNGTPLLATAGSGDVLSGIVAALLAQGMPAFEAACAAVWLHAEAAWRFGPGLIAEDLPLALRPVLAELAGLEWGGREPML